ncbi:hypothetical protein GCM10011490_15030 [Pseudoclavibacter endophyticus]|uniref:Rhamnan synthesis protein F n=1 Tax=Pseudoclavibacter endophyticus TaxID=1778590 RepID=A0A6H9WM60_9MICO|nr:rhamnan synthesis F family protein [Pseudoclavibacter endophyticus]KAB1649108.1 hypothetical protein F8O04_02165 [Pseudoclavibacter endophyticus]GGA65343.1 hypothetical protein GCM10011490_15030 [Pseudoclavibacter endophyticus]
MQRLVIVLLHDRFGRIDAGTRRFLEGLRPFAQRLHVVVNGALGNDGQRALAGLSDDLLVRENTGFDVGGYRAAIEAIGPRRLARFDELLMTNSTNFGPVEVFPGRGATFAHIFERQDARDVDVWGMTQHGEITPNPYTFRGTLPAHLQSNWLAVRASVLRSDAWAQYWASMPEITSYDDSIRHHESRFTQFFADAGFRCEPVFAAAPFGVANPSIEQPLALLRAGCPIVKRRLFFHDPVELDHRAVDVPEVARAMAAGGFDAGVIVHSAALTTPPRTLASALGGVRTLREPARLTRDGHPETAATSGGEVAIVGGMRMRRVEGNLWRRLADNPRGLLDDVDFIVSRGAYPVLGAIPPAEVGTRAITAGGDDDGGQVVDERPEHIADPAAVRAARDAGNALLADPTPIAWALADEPALGAIVPLTPHIGSEAIGHGWLGRRDAVEELTVRLGLDGPLDEHGPAAPYSAVAVYRPAALRPLADVFRALGGWGPLVAQTHGGGPELERQLDLLASRIVLTAGYLTVEVGTVAQLEASLAHLQAKYAEVAGMLPPGAREPIRYLRARRRGALSPEAIGETLVRRAPKFAQSLRAAIARWRS